ncbi:hypothetical protein EOD39_11732 [Acipenser ruthenus]|uniref:Uncharacterized protein n=1 Tax=Acipenser ruthenus TaxID=7906 RepID=A0A662YS06_ACIRT|nr:hypothetical protein EOD39_11732 [Acipenser ruthenus]
MSMAWVLAALSQQVETVRQVAVARVVCRLAILPPCFPAVPARSSDPPAGKLVVFYGIGSGVLTVDRGSSWQAQSHWLVPTPGAPFRIGAAVRCTVPGTPAGQVMQSLLGGPFQDRHKVGRLLRGCPPVHLGDHLEIGHVDLPVRGPIKRSDLGIDCRWAGGLKKAPAICC